MEMLILQRVLVRVPPAPAAARPVSPVPGGRRLLGRRRRGASPVCQVTQHRGPAVPAVPLQLSSGLTQAQLIPPALPWHRGTVLGEAVPVPGWFVCAGPAVPGNPNPAKSCFSGGGGFAELRTALLSEMGALQGQLGQRDTGRGQRDTERGCQGHRPAPPVLSETTAGCSRRARAQTTLQPAPRQWSVSSLDTAPGVSHFKQAGKHFTTLRLRPSVTCLSHKAWEAELCFEVCSASFKQLEEVFESRIGEDETLLTSSSHLPLHWSQSSLLNPVPRTPLTLLCLQGLTPNIL